MEHTDLDVAIIGQKRRVDQRGRRRIGPGKANSTAAVRPQHTDMAGKPMRFHFRATVVFEKDRHEVELQIRNRNAGPRLRKHGQFPGGAFRNGRIDHQHLRIDIEQ